MKKLLLLLPVILLLFNQRDNDIFIAPNGYGSAYADTASALVIGGGVSGHILSANADRNTARGNTTGTSVVNTSFAAGTIKATGGNYTYKRMFFGVTPIPNMVSCEACTLFFDGLQDRSIVDTTFQVFGASAYKSVIETEDFDQFDGWQSGTTAYDGTPLLATPWNSSSYSANWNALVLGQDGRAAVVAAKGDTAWFAMIDLRDYNSTWATDDSCHVAFTLAGAMMKMDYTPAVASKDNARGLLRGNISEGRKW